MDKQNIATLYPLTPLQQAFLWHSLQASSQAGLIHMRCTLHGDLSPRWLRQAWELVISHHPALRTSVHWESVRQPLQVVARQITLPWTHLDWRHHSDPQSALADFLAADRDCGFDLTQAPLSRITLIQLSQTDYELVWSCHHLMLDGWSGALVFNQVFDSYEALQQGQSPIISPALSYQTYVRWLKHQDQATAATFWQKTLTGFTTPTPLPCPLLHPPVPPSPPPPCPVLSSILLSPEATTTLNTLLKSHRLTLSTFMQGLWALLLHSYSGAADVLFGTTVSGRQGDLVGVEAIVGLLINVVPVRVEIAPEQAVFDWLQTLQTQQTMASRYAYASLDQIQGWSELSGRLFDSLLVIENYPIHTGAANRSMRVDNIQSGLVSTYGLTVIVKPAVALGETLTLLLQGDTQRFDQPTLDRLLGQLQAMLTAIAENPRQSIRDILPSSELATEHPFPSQSPAVIAPPSLDRAQLEGHFSAPNNPLELKLIQIWEAVLGVHPLSVEASFFDVGGDSLLAVRLFNQMQQALDCTLPLATLFQAPSVRQFAALINQEQSVSLWSSLVPIQPGGSRTPFFFHGGSADALTWARFAQQLGGDRPFYALQRPDLDGSEVIHTTVEALATACIKEMRMVQPAGPYLVGGHCLGGAVAFEIAQQLQAQGEELISVVLIDAYRPETQPETALLKLQNQLQLGVFWLRKNYYYHGGWENLAHLPSKLWQRFQPSLALLKPAAPHPVSPRNSEPRTTSAVRTNKGLSSHQTAADSSIKGSPSAPTPTTASAMPYEYRYARAQQVNEVAAAHYCPQPYAGRIKLFRAEIQILDWYFGTALGWQTVTQETVEITSIPGFFGNLFNQTSGPLLAEQVKTYLSTLV